MPNSLTEIDAFLEQVKREVAQLGGRLFEIDAERERHTGEADGLRGQTATAWQRTQDQIALMWAWYAAVSEAVRAVANQRQSAHVDRGGIDALWTELTSAPVTLPAESIDLARQCLPEDGRVLAALAIGPLISVMSKVLQDATETITSMFVARDMGLPKLNEIALCLATAEDAARVAGVRVPNEAGSIKDRLTNLREQLAADPLGVPVDDIGQLATDAGRIGQEIDRAVADVTGVDEALDHIDADLEKGLRDLSEARRDGAEAETKIAAVKHVPTSTETDELAGRLAELRGSLAEARQHARSGDRTAALRLATALGPAATQVRNAAEDLAASAAAPLAWRRELRGRLDAYRAKVRSLGYAEDPLMDELCQSAQDSLYSAPCDLREAERRLATYQAHIVACAQRENRHEL
jgi:hypothetical protein